jgi:hypothetical protein
MSVIARKNKSNYKERIKVPMFGEKGKYHKIWKYFPI